MATPAQHRLSQQPLRTADHVTLQCRHDLSRVESHPHIEAISTQDGFDNWRNELRVTPKHGFVALDKTLTAHEHQNSWHFSGTNQNRARGTGRYISTRELLAFRTILAPEFAV
jgi:hypothetical protein